MMKKTNEQTISELSEHFDDGWMYRLNDLSNVEKGSRLYNLLNSESYYKVFPGNKIFSFLLCRIIPLKSKVNGQEGVFNYTYKWNTKLMIKVGDEPFKLEETKIFTGVDSYVGALRYIVETMDEINVVSELITGCFERYF